MGTVLSKWGNSLAVRIPSDEATKAAFKQGDRVSVSIDQRGRLIIEAEKVDPDFDALYALITPENRHNEVSSGVLVGNEKVEW